jgi:hypothetical protein
MPTAFWRLDDPGIESRWGARLSAPVQTGPGAQPTSCTMGTGSFPGVKSGRGEILTPNPPTPSVDRTACTDPQCLYKSALYLLLPVSAGPITIKLTSVPIHSLSYQIISRHHPALCSVLCICTNVIKRTL